MVVIPSGRENHALPSVDRVEVMEFLVELEVHVPSVVRLP
jgi:hypothetical protein